MWRSLLLAAGVTWAVLCSPAPAPGQDSDRVWAMLRDGTEIEGREAQDWNDSTKMPKLAGEQLFKPGNPLRLYRDFSVSAALTGPRVYLANGDVLPGRTLEYRPPAPEAGLPARLLVQLTAPLAPWAADQSAVAVRLDRVLRLVNDREPQGDYAPGTLILPGGRKINTRGLRWTAEGVKVLTAEGIATYNLRDLAEVHLPETDTVQAVMEDGATPCPDAMALVGRMRVANGAELTYRHDMVRMDWVRSGRESASYHGVQPAWALSTIRVPFDQVALRSYRDRTEVPLSLLPAETLAQRSLTGYLWPWQRNQDVLGQTLAAGRVSSDLGLGMHAHAEVAFDLPPGAVDFSTIVGLAANVASGGSVECAVYADTVSGDKIWSSGLMTGARRPLGKARAVPVGRARRLVLVVDPALDKRNPGDDPLDIRDQVDWILPVVRVDPGALPRVERQWARWAPALEGWDLEGGTAGALRIGAGWQAAAGRWEATLEAAEGPVRWRRKVDVVSPEAVLTVTAVLGAAQPGPELTLGVEGDAQLTRRINPGPDRYGQEVVERLPLRGLVGRGVTLTLTLTPPARPGRAPTGLALRQVAVEGNTRPAPP